MTKDQQDEAQRDADIAAADRLAECYRITTENKSMRVQIPAYTDRWMMGDRYGVVVTTGPASIATRAKLHAEGRHRYAGDLEIAVVKLDKSRKTIRVVLADCTEV